MAMSRKERKREFDQQLYIAASFFKMKTFSNGTAAKDGTVLDPTLTEKNVNNCGAIKPFPHPLVTEQLIPVRELWPKLGKLLRDPDEIKKINKGK